jgi:RNA polymerase sigma factor (TIGR02999 family)
VLPLVYDELRQLAAAKLAQEKPGQTLEATALVHEAYLRLVDTEKAQHWDSRGHFFAAVAEAMRRILVENARRKSRRKHGRETSASIWTPAAWCRQLRRWTLWRWLRHCPGWPKPRRARRSSSSCASSPDYHARGL